MNLEPDTWVHNRENDKYCSPNKGSASMKLLFFALKFFEKSQIFL